MKIEMMRFWIGKWILEKNRRKFEGWRPFLGKKFLDIDLVIDVLEKFRFS